MKHFQQIIAQQPKTVLLVHHWDTDGLASAALMQHSIGEQSPNTAVTLCHPTINLYFLTEDQYQWIQRQRFDLIVCVDLNFPLEVFARLQTLASQLLVYDHHVQTADMHLPGAQDASYPGASQLIADQLTLPISLLSVLGMVGDQEDAIQRWEKFYPMVEQVMEETGMSFEQMHRLTKLLDGMAMVGDDEGLAYAVALLLHGCDNPQEIENDQRLLHAQERITRELEQELSVPMEDRSTGTETKLYVQEIASAANIISEVTRARAKQYPNDVIMTMHHLPGEYANVYVRTRRTDIDLSPLAVVARAKGLNAGGKREVVGTILREEQLQPYVDELTNEVKKLFPN